MSLAAQQGLSTKHGISACFFEGEEITPIATRPTAKGNSLKLSPSQLHSPCHLLPLLTSPSPSHSLILQHEDFCVHRALSAAVPSL